MGQGADSKSREDWIAEVQRVWQPTHILTNNERGEGSFTMLVELDPGLLGQLGVQRSGMELLLYLDVGASGLEMCALWCGNDSVIWDSLVGFCPAQIRPDTPSIREHAEAFTAGVQPLIRRNCFLLGADMGANEEEQRQWTQELAAFRAPAPNGARDENAPPGDASSGDVPRNETPAISRGSSALSGARQEAPSPVSET